MIRRAFTLVELCCSLVLLGTLTVVAVDWAGSVGRARQRAASGEELRVGFARMRAALRVDVMNDDARLAVLFGRERRLWVSGSTLHVLCRDRGPAEVRYSLDGDGAVVRAVLPLGGHGEARSDVIATGIGSLVWGFAGPGRDGAGSLVGRAESGGSVLEFVRLDVPGGWLP